MIINNNDKSKIKELLNLYYWVIGDDRFISILEKYSKCEGFGIENIWCCFANEYEEWEEDYFGESGVAYYFDYPAVEKDCTIILNNEEFYKYLVEKCEEYVVKYEDKKDIVLNYLNKIKSNLNL